MTAWGIAIGGAVVVGVAVVVLYRRLRAALGLLERSARRLESLLSPDESVARPALTALVREHERLLEQLGLKTLASQARALLVEVTRGNALAARAQIASGIELMTQLGLLGTVVGLIVAMGIGGETLAASLGLALVTTLLGLLAAVAARWRIEGPADDLLSVIESVAESEALRTHLAALEADA